MKKYRTLLFVVAIVVVVVAACKADPKVIIARKWQPIDASGETITKDVRRNLIKEGNMLEFTAEGIYKSYFEGEDPEEGTYTLDETAKHLTLKRDNDNEVEMHIRELRYRKLVLETNGVTISFEPIK